MAEVVSAGRRVASGIAWILGVQLVTAIVQLSYAAFTSRHADQTSFGQYAIALSATALVSLIATSGLGAAASRMSSTDEPEVRVLISLALLTGSAMALMLYLISNPWAKLWGNEGASPVIRLLAFGILVTPATAVQLGVLRREARFRQFAIASFLSSLVGMLVGAFFVLRQPSAASLAVLNVASSWVLLLVGILYLGRRSLPTFSSSGAQQHVSFGLKSLVTSLLIYAGVSAPQIAISRSLSTAVLGEWNRASVLGQIPLEMLSSSVQRSIYPEFRDASRDPEAAARAWTVLVGVSALAILPAVGILLPLLPSLVIGFFGPKWHLAGQMAGWILAATAINAVSGILSAAQESAGVFRPTWICSIVSGIALVSTGVGTSISSLWQVAAVGILVSVILGLLTQLVVSSRANIITLSDVLRSLILAVLLMCAAFALSCYLYSASHAVFLPALIGIPFAMAGSYVAIIKTVRFFPYVDFHIRLSRLIFRRTP